MECLDECFDYHLAQAENLSALFVAMNDERFEIRELTMCIIGRLSILNPAYIMPSLRKTLMQLLTELEYSGVGRNKEHSAQLLGHLVANAPTLICPYVEPILNVLIPKLKESDVNPMVVTSVLRAIGDLAHVGGSLMAKYVDELLPTLLEILNDASSSQKREVSLWTLAELVASTGSVVTPYTEFPSLLDTLLGFLKTEQKLTIRRQTLRLLGLLGALDPYQHKMMIGQVSTFVLIKNEKLRWKKRDFLNKSKLLGFINPENYPIYFLGKVFLVKRNLLSTLKITIKSQKYFEFGPLKAYKNTVLRQIIKFELILFNQTNKSVAILPMLRVRPVAYLIDVLRSYT